MTKLQQIIHQIKPLDAEAMHLAQTRQDTLTKPQGSLGRLEEFFIQVAGIQGRVRPIIEGKVIAIMAADWVPVVLDGFITRPALQVRDYLIAAHQSVEVGHVLVMGHLELEPLLDLDLRLGEGTGAALGISLVETGAKILNEMATFAEAGISEALE